MSSRSLIGAASIVFAAGLTLAGCSTHPPAAFTSSAVSAAASVSANPSTASGSTNAIGPATGGPGSTGGTISGGSAGPGTGDWRTTLPTSFPLPPGARVEPVIPDGKVLNVNIDVPNAQQAASFWDRQLSRVGYAETDDGNGDITFKGDGRPDGRLTFVYTIAILVCHQS